MEKFKKTKDISFIILSIAAVVFTIHLIFFNYTIFLIIPLIKATYLFLNIFLIGFIISSLIKKDLTILENLGTGIIFTFFYFYIISFLHLLNSFFIGLYYLMGAIIFFIVFKNENLKEKGIKLISSFFKRNPLEFLVFLIPFLFASLPSTFYDTLVYHLGIPNLYLRNGGFVKTPFFLYANTSVYYEISLIPAVYTGDLVPRLLHFLISSVFILCFIDFVENYFNLRKRKYLILLILSMTVSLFLISTVKNDIIAALFIFLGILNFLEKRYVFSGVFFGFSIGIKYFSLFPILIFLFLEIFPFDKIRIKKVFAVGFIIVVLISPLFIKNYVFTSNPIYPFFNSVFKSNYWDSNRNYYLKRDVGKIIHSFKDIFRSLYLLSFKNYGSGGRIGPIFLVFLPFIAIFGTKRLKILFFALISAFIGCLFGGSIRYFYISILFLTPFVMEIFEQTRSKLLEILFFIIIAINFVLSFTTLEMVYSSYLLYSHKASVYTYKVGHFPAYKIYSFINMMLSPGGKILIVGEPRTFYLKKAYSVSSPYDYSILKPYLDNSRTPKEFFQKIKKNGFDYIFLSLGEFLRLQKEYNRLNKEEYKKFIKFFSSKKPVFHKEMFFIYKL